MTDYRGVMKLNVTNCKNNSIALQNLKQFLTQRALGYRKHDFWPLSRFTSETTQDVAIAIMEDGGR